MAATYIANRQQIRFTTGKAMMSLFNGVGSGVVAKVYRLWVHNLQLTAVTGIPVILQIDTISAASGGTPAQVNRMRTDSPTIPAQLLIAEGMSVTSVATLRKFPWSTDEAQIVVGSIDEIQLQRPFINMLDFDSNSTNVQPITLREGEGISLIVPTTVAINVYCNISIEFTLE